VELRDVDIPEIGPDEVLLKVSHVGICGSDLHQWTADHSWPVNYPVVLGHEFSGHVQEAGKEAKGWKVGDKVVSETAAVIDPANPMTRQGFYNLDSSRKGFGYGVNGAMTSLVRVPARCLHRVPDGLSFEHACLTEPCSVAYNAVVMNCRVRPGDRMVVLGPGTIGILCAALGRLSGADVLVIGLPSDDMRLRVAKHYGCDTQVGNAPDWAMAQDGLGADCVVDATGVSASLEIALKLVRPNGQVAKVGWGKEPVNFSLDPLVQKNIRLQGSFSHNWGIWEKVIGLLASSKLDVNPLIGGIWELAQWLEAFELMHSRKIVKSILKPT
jgi:alcohol dehydrogenase/L-iditol 2-dehydrogenase